ncbi:MAG TPA: hypothetical protein VFE33_05870 [Thermoanaerobaculia bacterium]|nr:hypothetical protein [Thermoanaerobaculia bacterium]
MTTSYRQVLPTLALVAMLAGCGPTSGSNGSGTVVPPAKNVDACTLFTAVDAQAVLAEEEVVEMTSFLNEAQKTRDPAQCGYNAGSDPSKVVRLEVRRAASAESAQGAFDSTRSLLAGSAPQDVPGLGDGAFWVGGSLDQLHVRKGATQLIITSQTTSQTTSQPGEGKDPLAVAKAIAGKALPRL